MGNKIKAVRMARGDGMTCERLARISKVPEATVRGLEHYTERTPRGDTMLALARALDVAPEELLDDATLGGVA